MLSWNNFKFISLFAVPLFLGVVAWTAFPNKKVQAEVRCETQYGGGEICTRTGELQIDKQVWDPGRGIFVDNLSLGDHNFLPGDEVTWRVRVRNVGHNTLFNVRVRDTLPSELELTSGSLDLDFGTLLQDESKTQEIKTKVRPTSQLGNRGLFCINNFVDGTSSENKDPRTSQICIDNRVLGAVTPVKVTPKTGATEWVIGGLIFAGAIGFLIKRKINF